MSVATADLSPGTALSSGSLYLVDRNDRTVVGRWWWTLDRPLLITMLMLMGCGLYLVATAGQVVVERQGWDEPFHFLVRHLVFTVPSVIMLVAVSMLSVTGVRRFAFLMMLGSLALLAVTPVLGDMRNGAVRWIDVGLLTLQPSEFAKPAFAVCVAWFLAHRRVATGFFPGALFTVALYGAVIALLVIQPDLGQSFLITAILGVILFLAGLPLILVAVVGALGVVGLTAAYFVLDHVRDRVDSFLFAEGGETPFQVRESLETIAEGGLLGRGPFAGSQKWSLPDAHTDFLYSVAIEELGVVFGIVIVVLYLVLVLRGFSRLARQGDLFVLLAGAGLLSQFALQASVHLASCLALIPPKGMTLPLLSYGGSSMLSLCLAGGMVLALTRRSA